MICRPSAAAVLLLCCSGCTSPAALSPESPGGRAAPGELRVARYRLTDVGVRRSGFYPIEYDEAAGELFAWSHGTSSIGLDLQAPEAVQWVSLVVASRAGIERIEIQTPEGTWIPVQLDRWQEQQEVRLPSAVAPDDRGQLLLTWRSSTWLPGGKDPRTLGVAVRGLSVYSRAPSGPSLGPPAKLKRRLVILVGPVAHGPTQAYAAGEHEHLETAQLLARALRSADRIGAVEVQVLHLPETGLPSDPAAALEAADTIVVLSEGMERSPFSQPELHALIARQVERGCGLVVVHRAMEVPRFVGHRYLMSWLGGFIDAGSEDPHLGCELQLADWAGQRDHPVLRGVEAFDWQDEQPRGLRLRARDARFVPLLPWAGFPEGKLWAWAWDRGARGRSVALLAGHSFDTWRLPGLRRVLLNAVVWSAGIVVPARGVDSVFSPAAAAAAPGEQTSR